MKSDIVRSESQGFVLAATGEPYVTLARRAARSLRQVHPEAEVDLFTDAKIEDGIFSQINRLSDSWFRPKIEALARSRFERTVYLDADVMVVADVSSAFDLMDRFDFAAAQDRYLNNCYSDLQHKRPIPNAFPVLNSGVMVINKSPETKAFLAQWQREMRESLATRDQPVLRELLYDSELRFATLPPGYNLLTFHELRTWWDTFGAPRVLHASHLHSCLEGPGEPTAPYTVEELIGRPYAKRLRLLTERDSNLTPKGSPKRVSDQIFEHKLARKLRHAVSGFKQWLHARMIP